jgi:hypothetical protein
MKLFEDVKLTCYFVDGLGKSLDIAGSDTSY